MTTFDTQALIPWAEPVAYTRARAAGDLGPYPLSAGVTQISAREAARSNGVSVARDITVEFAADALAAPPKERDRVRWKGKSYAVYAVGGDPEWLRFYSLSCRCPELAYDLRDLADVLRPAPTPTAGGLRRANPATLAAAVPCRLQPDDWSLEPDTAGRVTTRRRYTAYLGLPLELAAGDVLSVAGVKYECVSQSEMQQLDTLTAVKAERVG